MKRKTIFYNNNFCKECVEKYGKKHIEENHLCQTCKAYWEKK